MVPARFFSFFSFFQGTAGGAAPEPSGPGVAEVTSVDGSIVMVLKPNELAKKKRKFKQVTSTDPE